MKFVYDEVMEIEEKIKAQEAMQKRAEQNDGIEAPVFTLNDLEGKPLSLTSLRGRYVVLDFWGSWCVACIGGFPTKIIIAPDGKIFKTIIGEDSVFYTLLDELFGK